MAVQLIKPHDRDLGGGFMVRRLLPSLPRPSVGPFVFFDHFGPITAGPAADHEVRPHPHIGLATVTYLLEGAMVHRDSTGVVQRIEPGAINWMTAGRGIVHSERTPDELRNVTRNTHGLQLWAALPEHDEDGEPSFAHAPADTLPVVEGGGAMLRVLIGSAFGVSSPVATRSPTLYLDLALRAGAKLDVPAAASERALYSVDAPFMLDGSVQPPRTLVVLDEGSTPELGADTDARLVLIGGEPLGHRFLWWNFVASSRDRIVKAADEWAAYPESGLFPRVPGESEFIPLPDKRPSP
jgi:redox-sensitive bicupin YhaK (pirin superfamily)